MSGLVFSVPLNRVADFPGNGLVIRTDQPHLLVSKLGADDLDRVAFVRLESLPSDIVPLIHWADGLAIEIALEHPEQNFSLLYRYAKLLDNHPVRVSIPVEDGFQQAAKLALSLQYSVRLELGQPSVRHIAGLEQLLDSYLHQVTVSQPIECFQYLLLGFFHSQGMNLWLEQEADPAALRVVDDDGNELMPGKLMNTSATVSPDTFIDNWLNQLIEQRAECADCAYRRACRGYFKWPDTTYDCRGVKSIFSTLHQAAVELRADLAAADSR